MKHATILVTLLSTAALVGCASKAPLASTGTGVSQQKLAATAAAPEPGKLKVPSGYRRVVMGGKERFCRIDHFTDSRAQKVEVCLTASEIQALQDSSQDFMQRVQRAGGVNPYACTPGAGGAMGGPSCNPR